MQIIRDTSAITPEPCVATIGFFDGVHAGHRYLIQQVKEIAAAKGLRSALVTFPVHPRKVMNAEYRPELLTTPEEKISLLADIGVDYCLMLDFTPEISRLTAREFMTQLLKERYQVKYLVIGYDHRFGHNRSEGFEDYVRYGKEIGIEVIRAKAYTSNIEIGNEPNIPVSSSLIRKLLHEGEGNTVIVELTNGEKYRGHLVRSEDNMNCQLTSVTMRARDGKLSKLENVFIRGSRVRYIVLPDLLKQSPMFQKIQKLKEAKESVEREKNKLKGSMYLLDLLILLVYK